MHLAPTLPIRPPQLSPAPGEEREERGERGDRGHNRAGERATPLLKTAKLVAPDGEYLCIIRDVSSGGVSLRLLHERPPGENFILELPNGDRHPLALVWHREDRAGFRFAQEADLARIILGQGAYPRRPLRLRLEVPARLLAGLRRVEARILDISRQGARIDCAEQLARGSKVRLGAAAMPPMAAQVRWQQGRAAGLSFQHELGFEELALMVRDLRQHSLAGA